MMDSSTKPLVAIVGRPNVGKSTLFNRLVGRSEAIVSGMVGTTRDRVTAQTDWGGHTFTLVDTGGLGIFPEVDLWQQVRDQIDVAIREADVIVMLVDASTGISGSDRDVADTLRVNGKTVVLAANKADNQHREGAAVEFHELGLGDPIPVSAYHNLGIDDLMAQVTAYLPVQLAQPEQEADTRFAIIGRPNVGKSMLLNAITREERAIVSQIPGTTRDALDTLITHKGKRILLIDTAGIRRRGRVESGVERYSVLRSVRAIDRADVAIQIIDASELATSQDAHIAGYILDAFRGIMLVINKWDLASDLGLSKDLVVRRVKERFKFASYVPICFSSALVVTGIDHLLETAYEVYSQWTMTVPRYDLRRTIMHAIARHPPPSSGKHALKIYGVAQDQSGPPSFTFYVNRPDMVHFSYRRFLENILREAYEFKGSPIRMRFRGRGMR